MTLPASIAAFANGLRNGDSSVLATVTAVNGDGTVDLGLVPSGTLPKVRPFTHYTLSVGNRVVVTRMPGGDLFIPGKYA
ncbi:hypothetical protein [Embleya sp. NPDC005971]|uniref:hypothetical protein n=1 Tax=Embleya sp. NPDC005971 TaxID=3156724 RepID=UPI0033EEC481